MRFTSRYRNLSYVIDRAIPQRDSAGNQIGVSTPFRVVFGGTREGVFDSDTIEDPDKRKRAEDFLLKHKDLGVWYHVEQAEQATQTVLNTCIGTIAIPGEPSAVCGKPTEPGQDYCAACLSVPEGASA